MEENNENVVDETTQEQTVETVDENKFDSAGDDSVIKIDLDKPIENETTEETTEVADDTADGTRVVGSDENTEPVQEQEEVQPEVEAQEQPVVEEVTEEEIAEEAEEVAEQVEEAIAEAEATGEPLPENIQKLVDFMNETGGDIQDYVRLNQDYKEMDSSLALEEYYRLTKPHLTEEERRFLMDETFSYDEEVDDEREVRRKKIALKEQVAEAKAYLDGQKSKYYDEIKAGSKLTGEQQKAIDFFNRYNKESSEQKTVAEKQHRTFLNKTNQLFNDKFKGFEYNVGDKKFRFNVKNADNVKETQSDINNFVKKFLNEDNTMSDAKGYHKSLFTAMNADTIAQHFYEQGKADALKESVAKSKNVNMNPRQQHSGEVNSGGMKVRVLGESSNDFKFKIKNRK
tara:strand:+ start:1025 stop:2224 length:1200 start_codon:yes stop_codon:yes gene_type:complete